MNRINNCLRLHWYRNRFTNQGHQRLTSMPSHKLFWWTKLKLTQLHILLLLLKPNSYRVLICLLFRRNYGPFHWDEPSQFFWAHFLAMEMFGSYAEGISLVVILKCILDFILCKILKVHCLYCHPSGIDMPFQKYYNLSVGKKFYLCIFSN